MTRKVKKAAGKESTQQPTEVMPHPLRTDAQMPAKVVQLRIDISVHQGDPRNWDEFVQEIKETILASNPDALVTPMGGYYLIGGKVCLPKDYDPATNDFKPGTYPPSWAGGPTEAEIRARITREQSLPPLARNPANLLTAKETDRLHEVQGRKSRLDTPGAAMDDFYKNTEVGRARAAERAEREERIKQGVGVAKPQDDDDDVMDEDIELDLDDEDRLDELMAEEEEDAIAELTAGDDDEFFDGDEEFDLEDELDEADEDDEDFFEDDDMEEDEEEEEEPPAPRRRSKIVRQVATPRPVVTTPVKRKVVRQR